MDQVIQTWSCSISVAGQLCRERMRGPHQGWPTASLGSHAALAARRLLLSTWSRARPHSGRLQGTAQHPAPGVRGRLGVLAGVALSCGRMRGDCRQQQRLRTRRHARLYLRERGKLWSGRWALEQSSPRARSLALQRPCSECHSPERTFPWTLGWSQAVLPRQQADRLPDALTTGLHVGQLTQAKLPARGCTGSAAPTLRPGAAARWRAAGSHCSPCRRALRDHRLGRLPPPAPMMCSCCATINSVIKSSQ